VEFTQVAKFVLPQSHLPMSDKKIQVLDQLQIDQKINRIAYHIYEDHCDEKELIIAGIADRGFVLATLISDKLKSISDMKVSLVAMHINKENPTDTAVEIPLKPTEFRNKVVILVDDVLNSGKTLIYGARHFLVVPLKRLSTAVLVDRRHRRFPIRADYVGLSLATTMKEHISVEFNKKGKSAVYLS
jgi:pyrimidine operon attenuation protein/uracil phosphoribosyltransferase